MSMFFLKELSDCKDWPQRCDTRFKIKSNLIFRYYKNLLTFYENSLINRNLNYAHQAKRMHGLFFAFW